MVAGSGKGTVDLPINAVLPFVVRGRGDSLFDNQQVRRSECTVRKVIRFRVELRR